MSAEIIPFDFEEQAVRVIMREDEPWFVAADVCRVLGLKNSRQSVSRLDDDEKGVHKVDTLGGQQAMTVISLSGLLALSFTSNKPEAKRFRKWVTSVVLPSILKHGYYIHPDAEMPGVNVADTGGDIAGVPIREAEMWLSMVRETRLTRGTRAAARLWDRSPLPPMVAANDIDPAEGRAALAHLMGQLSDVLSQAREGVPVDALAGEGLRVRHDGVFVANFAVPAFDGTHWKGGLHRAALATLPGVVTPPHPLTLAGVRTRGLILPWALIDGEAS